MPEEPEIDTDKLRETIDEEIERSGSSMLRWVSLSTALLAAIAAVASLRAGDTVNEALALKSDATRVQAQASDQWAYYQAKGIKGAIAEAAQAPWRSLGKRPPADLPAKEQRYAAEQGDIRTKAEALEHEGELRSQEADHLLHRHHGFANAVALFQVAIALGALAALTRNRPVWLASLGLGGVGLALLAAAFG